VTDNQSDSNPEVDALRGPDLRRALFLTTLAWVFGSVWLTATSGAPLTLFAKGLGASNFQIGLLAALPFIASLASLPASLLIDRTGARKLIFLCGLYAQRFMWFPIAIVPPWLLHVYGADGAPLAMTLFLVMVLLMHTGQAVGGPAWVSWMADVVPDRSRGKYFSRRRQWGILSAVPTALLVGWLLDRHVAGAGGSGDVVVTLTTMIWISGVFMVAAVFGTLDIALFHGVKEVRAARRFHQPLRKLIGKPLRDRQFLWFAGFVGTMIFAIGPIGHFITLYLIDKVKVNTLQTQLILLAVPGLAQLLVLPVWGKLIDRYGRKPALVIASLGLVPVGLGWCLMNSGAVWLGYVLAVLGAALWVGVEVANFNLTLEMSGLADADDEGGSAYVAVNSVIINVAGLAGGLTWGLIAQGLKDWSWDAGVSWLSPFTFYEVLFLLSAVIRLLAVVIFLPHLHEPKARPTREALRFMSANIYNNLFNAVMQPVRFITNRRDETYRE